MQACRRPGRFPLPDTAADLVHPPAQQLLRVQGRAARQQLVQQDAERVDVTARIDVHRAHLDLLWAHVGRRPDKLPEMRDERLVRQFHLGGLGQSKIDDLGQRRAIGHGDENVRRLEIAVDDSLLVGVLDGIADPDEQFQPLGNFELLSVGVLGDRTSLDELHHEIRPAGLGGARIEHFRDARMVHQSQGLTFGFKAGHHLPGVHAEFDDLQRDLALYRLELFGQIDDPKTAFPNRPD